MKRFFVAFVCAVALFTSAPAQAAPILTTDTDAFVGTVIFDLLGAPVFQVVSGSSTANITDGALIASGVIAATDGDSSAFVDFGVDDAYLFDFDFTTSVFDPSGIWSVVANGTPVFVSDPALLPFIGANLGQFSILTFNPFFNPETQQQIGFIGSYKLDFIASQEDVTAVPEPATLGLVGSGILMAIRRRRAKKNNASKLA